MMDKFLDRSAPEVLAKLCLEAEELALDEGPERSMQALEELARAYPDHPAPRVSLAKLYRWMALRGKSGAPIDRSKLQTAVEHAKQAIALEDPPHLDILDLVRRMLHMLAEHEEGASYLSSIAADHPDPATAFKALTWAASSLQCRGMELEAEGRIDAANAAYHNAVEMHRRALQSWPDATVALKLSSFFGDSHVMAAYSAVGLAGKWVAEVEGLLSSEEELDLPGEMRGDFLNYASEMASEAGLYQKAIELAEKALRFEDGGNSPGAIRRLGSLMIAHRAAGDELAQESAAQRIERILQDWEGNVEEDRNLPPENRLPGAYHVASRAFVRVEDWERAIRASARAAELRGFGPNHWFLAVSLWAGRKDREGALKALRNAARDVRLSGNSDCRNLRDDFLRSAHFRDVHEDEEFLTAVEIADAGPR